MGVINVTLSPRIDRGRPKGKGPVALISCGSLAVQVWATPDVASGDVNSNGFIAYVATASAAPLLPFDVGYFLITFDVGEKGDYQHLADWKPRHIGETISE